MWGRFVFVLTKVEGQDQDMIPCKLPPSLPQTGEEFRINRDGNSAVAGEGIV